MDFESVAAGTTAESFTFNIGSTVVDVIRLGTNDPLSGNTSANGVVAGDDLGIFDSNFQGGPDNGNDEDLGTASFVGELIEVDMFGSTTVSNGPVDLSLGNILVGNEPNSNNAPDDDAGGSRFLFSFAPPANSITEIILIDTEDGGASRSGGTVNAYSDIVSPTIVGSFTFDGEGANNSGRIISIEFGPGVSALEVILEGSGAVGEISFLEVPEPSTWAAIVGSVALGFTALRRYRARRA